MATTKIFPIHEDVEGSLAYIANPEQTDNGRSTLERSGNIGVTTSQQMIQSERDIIIDVLDWYVAKFISGFIWGGI